jgi:hypothetical protein
MKNLIFVFMMILICQVKVIGQTESYVAKFVSEANAPVIDGNIDAIWNEVEQVPLLKVPEIGGIVHSNITEPQPAEDDFSASFGMIWNDNGMFFIFTVVDEKIVIEDDDPTLSAVPADKWWTDDNINLLFSKDLLNNSFTQWEFAWQPGIDQEEKLSSDDWLNPALIDISLVSSAWNQDGDTWTLETFISWNAFADGTIVITPGQDIYLEARARDDDDDGPWESMFQWSTTNYEIEKTGVGMGTVTLSTTEIEVPTGLSNLTVQPQNINLYPSISSGLTNIHLNLDRTDHVTVNIYSLNGEVADKIFYNNVSKGNNVLSMNLSHLEQGLYIVVVNSDTFTGIMKFAKQ